MNTEAMMKVMFAAALIAWARKYIEDRIELAPCDKHELPCWVWKCGGDGRYGHAYLFGSRIKAHVLSFLAWGGRLKRKQVVDHKVCDRTNCCQPAHLCAATQSQNIKRCFAVGRGRSPFLKGE